MNFQANNEKLKKALGEKFTFSVDNASGSTVTVALFPANFDTHAITAALTGTAASLSGNAETYTPAGTIAVTSMYTSKTEINNAGYSAVNCALDDGTIATSVTATALNSAFRIRHFLNFIKHNPITLKSMTIQGTDSSVFNVPITVAYVSPLGNYGVDTLNLNEYYGINQTSTTKIELNDLNMPVDDTLLMYIPIAASKTVTFTYKF